MSGFAGTAARLAGVVPRLLGWLPDEFWSCTPAELSAILASGEAATDPAITRAELTRWMEREGDG